RGARPPGRPRGAGPRPPEPGGPPRLPAPRGPPAVPGARRPAAPGAWPPPPGPAIPAPPSPPGGLAAGLLPAVDRRRRPSTLAGPATAALLAGMVTVLVTALVGGLGGGPEGPAVTPVGASGQPGGPLAQYDYTVRLPAGWRHTGGLPERRRILLTPAGSPSGSDLISVEQTQLGYDSAAERDRAFGELGDRFQQARLAGARL